ncbi:hypothetical protein POTOM_005901 [Populus tomentosa]|uniref:Uncharacterized protein n=1 Tax=Populus tomentosa TaxID=118781 RepID=A0A8X8AML8_POPTO|nr:hypothetical protein POTOM_005901 [Populus tomentosa]
MGSKICILIMKFPSAEAGLPEGCENASSIETLEMVPKFFKAVSLLQQPLEYLLEECRPNCLVADMMFPWATKVASKFGIPRLVFHGTSYFALCASDCLKRFEPYRSVETDLEPFTVPGLPDKIKLTRLQLPPYAKENSEFSKRMDEISRADLESYGVIMNSFHELEPAYSEHYKMVIGRKAWHIGPVSLCNRDTRDKMQRGGVASIDENECLRWLAMKKFSSVLYICFGSMSKTDYSVAQLFEISKALTASGQNIIWAVKNGEKTKDVLKIGVAVGAQEWSRHQRKILVKKEEIENAITQLMVGEVAEGLRNRTKALKEMARRATEVEGSSYCDLNALLEDLRAINIGNGKEPIYGCMIGTHDPLVKTSGMRIIQESSVPSTANVSDVIRNVDLKWPAARSVDMLNIKAAPWEGSRLE